jgi:hypothetical protein
VEEVLRAGRQLENSGRCEEVLRPDELKGSGEVEVRGRSMRI